jgi:hypothetical protein
MDMEVEFLRRDFTEQNLKSLMDHVQRMATGEAAFFPATLSLIYGGLFQKVFPEPATSGSLLGGSPEAGGESVARSAPAVQPRNSSAARSSNSTYRIKFPSVRAILLYLLVYFLIAALPNASGK